MKVHTGAPSQDLGLDPEGDLERASRSSSPSGGSNATPLDGDFVAGDLEVRAIYRAHARFVWLSLQRLGVHPSDVEDVAQDVFLIVHRRLNSYDRRARITTWLFGICMRVAANYRRRRRWTWEVLTAGSEDRRPAAGALADDLLVRREERRLAEQALARLHVSKRATFVMFEIESLSCQEIAELMNVPIGTVYSRLYAARRQLERFIARHKRDPDPDRDDE